MDELKGFLSKLILERDEIVDFGSPETGAEDSLIMAAEEKLKVKFPPSYKWWLKYYGGGRIYGDEVFSLYGDWDIPSGDIVYMNLLYRRNKVLDDSSLAVLSNDMGETFYLNLLDINAENESPVYRLSNGQKYCNNFLEFLKKQIEEDYM